MAVAPAGVECVRERFGSLEVDGFLVTHPLNMRYLVGFTGDVGLLLIWEDGAELAVDPRYTEQARREVNGLALREVRGEWQEALAEMVGQQGLQVVGIEADHVSVSQHHRWVHALPEGVVLRPLSDVVEAFRAVKTSEEIAVIERAVRLTDETLMALRGWLRPGVSERDAAWFVESYVRTHGGEAMAFDPIVAAGTNGAMAHARPTDRAISAEEPIVVDIGARVDGYCADLTRTLWMGPPSDRFQSLYNLVLEAQLAAENGMKAGMAAKDADALARSVIQASGYGDQFGHGLGHGVGLAVHEAPRVSQRSDAVLEKGNVCTVEPGVYLPDWGGIRIEDVVVIEAGRARVLTRASKEPWLAI
ncbi:MAG: M24 family metallopeptidase [Anaerolineae bacterium]|nr:M24 family metallopeptidase [Anaerolineae bacterium]